jgi:hypothetical protein
VAFNDPELELYRGLVDQPESFEEGFDIKAIIGALFVGFVMMPGAIYLGLVAGSSLGPAAQWTTVILFTEVARRSFVTLRKQEVFILLYIAGALASGGAFSGVMFMQYFVRSPAAKGMGIANEVPTWVVPGPNSPAILHRTFFHQDWLIPGALIVLGTILGRLQSFGLGYIVFRVTSDYQKLPFPFAGIGAQGATALAEASTREETWRWRTFSIGAMVGLVFGMFYIGIPTITGVIMSKPLTLLPIPWVDLTRSTETILPAVPTGFVTDLGTIINGFVAPFWAEVGSFASALITFALNPYLHKIGVLSTWKAGMGTIETGFANQIDFYFSVGIGVAMAIFVISMYMIVRSTAESKRVNKEKAAAGQAETRSWAVPKGRGDFPMWLGAAMWIFATLCYVVLCAVLVPRYPIVFVLLFGFVLTPVQSFIDATMIGMVGQWVSVPFVKESTIILSKYKGIDIWFAPIPLSDFGGMAQHFRVIELTGTKITSMIKAELMIWPITVFCSLLFWQFIWRLAPIPSVYYPFAQKMWHLQALQQGLWLTSTLDYEKSLFYKSWNPKLAVGGFGFGVISYSVLAGLRLPQMLVFGIVRGLGTGPHGIFPEMIGALISQFYFVPRFGARKWKQYATVLAAGYACGMGLIGMGTIALAMIGKSVSQMPY